MANKADNKDPPTDQWIVDMQLTMGCVNLDEVKTCSICRVPERFREVAKDKGDSYYYRPQHVAMGPFHRGTSRSDLQIMEEPKWRYMQQLHSRPTPGDRESVKQCSEAVKGIVSIIRASYGEKIEMESEELARVMLLDASFFLELLIRLSNNQDLKFSMDDEKRMLRVLTDLTLLENQIPFAVLTTLSREIFSVARLYAAYKLTQDQEEQEKAQPQAQAQAQAHAQEAPAQEQAALTQAQVQNLAGLLALTRQDQKLCPQSVATLFKCNVANVDFNKGVYHFLHLMHLCSPDPYNEQRTGGDPKELNHSARKLHAFGIKITGKDPDVGNANAGHNNAGNNNNEGNANVLAALEKFRDNFNFKIEFDEDNGELSIPTLHIKEATEVKWRNFIAWEQCGLIGVGYKFTSYAHFFKGLVSSVDDIQLLKQNGVLRAYEGAKDEELLTMFKSITTGTDRKDGRYNEVCDGLLNVANVKGYSVLFIWRMVRHYWRRFWRWLRHGFKSSVISFKETYMTTIWTFLGVVVATALLAITIIEFVYTIRTSSLTMRFNLEKLVGNPLCSLGCYR